MAAAEFSQVQTLKKSGKKKAHTFQSLGTAQLGQLGAAPRQKDHFSLRNMSPELAHGEGNAAATGPDLALRFWAYGRLQLLSTELLWEAQEYLKKEPALQIDARNSVCVCMGVFKGPRLRSTGFLRGALGFLYKSVLPLVQS